MESFEANIVVIPKSSILEKLAAILLVAFILIPCLIAFFTHQLILFISLPIGLLLILIFNLLTNNKFRADKWVKHDQTLTLTMDAISIKESGVIKSMPWEKLNQLILKVYGYKGEGRSMDTDSGTHDGTTNNIHFHFEGVAYSINFYLKDENHKAELRAFLTGSFALTHDFTLIYHTRAKRFNTSLREFRDLHLVEYK